MATKTNKPLWETNAEILSLAEQIDDLKIIDGQYVNTLTGERFDLDVFDKLDLEYDEKMKNCIYVVKRMKQQEAGIEGQIAFVEKQLADLKNRLSSNEKRRKWFEGYLINCINGEKWGPKDKSCSCYIKKTSSVNILNEEKIPINLFTIKTTQTPNKTAIKEAILNGEKIEGAEIQYSASLVVR